MSHIPFTLLAYLLNATATTIDKFLLTKNIQNPLVYVFYFSVFSLLGLLPLPFTKIPTLQTFFLASTSTVLWTTGAYFMFKALQLGQASRVIPIIGTLIPIILLIAGLATNSITQNQLIAIIMLILGFIFLTLLDLRGELKKAEAGFEILSAVLFAVSYLILRQAYLSADFLTVLVWGRFVIIPVSLVILVVPKLRHIIFSSGNGRPAFKLVSRAGLLFLIGQAAGGSSELLITFSVSLANPALVNSLQGTQYAFLFLFTLFLAHRFPQVYKERLSLSIVLTKIIGIAFIAGGLFLLAR